MNSVSHTVEAKLGSNSLWSKVFGNLRVARADHLSECLHDVGLANFQNDRRSRDELLNLGNVLWKHSLINIIEFLNSGLGEVEHLEGSNFKALI